MSQPVQFDNANDAVEAARLLLTHETNRIAKGYQSLIDGEMPSGPVRGYYPEISLEVPWRVKPKDKTQPFGHCRRPGVYRATISGLDILDGYYKRQLDKVVENHDCAIDVRLSSVPIPLKFALASSGVKISGEPTVDQAAAAEPLFDKPDAYLFANEPNGSYSDDAVYPLAHYNAPYIDRAYSRIQHYTGTHPRHFQKYVMFTNYDDYMDLFRQNAEEVLSKKPDSNDPNPYIAFVEPGNRVTLNEHIPNAREHFDLVRGAKPGREPQMPAYHLVRADGTGVSIVDIGVGPSNAKTMTDELAILRSNAWFMIGHCAGLDDTQDLGDYVIPNGFVLEDGLMEKVLGHNVDIPELSEMHVATTQAIRDVLKIEGDEYKRSSRTGIITTVSDRNWEVPDKLDSLRVLEGKFRNNRSIALDMESGTLSANGFRHRVPYGSLLCVSDKPLHGELKLAGDASKFYKERVQQQFDIAMRAMENLREMGESVHSRKLRSGFDYSPFL